MGVVAMNVLRFLLWVTAMGAVALSGPNLPAQLLALLRDMVQLLSRSLGFNRSA